MEVEGSIALNIIRNVRTLPGFLLLKKFCVYEQPVLKVIDA